ncbi:cell division protein ZipA [Gammaproteobacteria bacterium]|nr:cell division protein ZipA [Gammaproteobacteria bacterium]
MEIKELMLYIFGTVIVIVVVHGLWVAWRKNQQRLRFDFVDGVSEAYVDEIDLLKGELPNGGARLVDISNEPIQENNERVEPEMKKTKQGSADARLMPELAEGPKQSIEILTQERLDFSEAASTPARANGYEVAKKKVLRSLERVGQIKFKEDKTETPLRSVAQEPVLEEGVFENAPDDTLDSGREVLELLVLNVLAPTGTVYHGRSLVEAMQSQGLKYGDMNIFHRIDQQSKSKLFSVANALEPGTFDLSDLENVKSSGITFFMQLPSPNDPSVIFDLMLNTARNLVLELGGSLKDEQLSVLTGQTVEHMRQRIADFSRRRMSVRA